MQNSVPSSVALLGLIIGVWPVTASAQEQCDALNPGVCLDSAMYNFYIGIAAAMWSFDRTLLLLAYQLDHMRWWLANQAFLVVYSAIRAVATPLLTPAAMLAIIVGLVLFLLVPMLGRIQLINIRQVFIWLLIAPLLLSEAGVWMIELERLRDAVGGQITRQVGGVTAQGLFGGGGSDTDTDYVHPPVALYPAAGGGSACGSITITRPQAADPNVTDPSIRMDDLAAALLLANAKDIHCPGEQSPNIGVPSGFEGVFTVSGGLEGRSSTERATALTNIQQGIIRLLLGIVACVLAVGEVLIQLAFTLGLVVVWLCLPLVALLIIFSDTLRPLGMLVQRMLSITFTAWVVTAIMSLISVCLMGGAASGSGSALIALSFGGLFLLWRLLLVAFSTLTETFHGITSLAGTTASIALAGAVVAAESIVRRGVNIPGGMVRKGLDTAGDVATGSMKAAAVAGMAARATGSGSYAVSAALGSIRPLAQVGAVAASMGLLSEETGAGLYAGERAARSGMGAFARQLQSDTKRKLSDGHTVSERSRQRRIAQELKRSERPTLLERAEHAFDYLGSGHMAGDMVEFGDGMIESVQRSRAKIGQGATNLRQGAITIAQTIINPERLGEVVAVELTNTAEAIRQRDLDRRPAARKGRAVKANTQGHLEYLPNVQPPTDAISIAPGEMKDRAGLLAAGFTMQDQPDGSSLIWNDIPGEVEMQPEMDKRRAALIKAGLLAQDAVGSGQTEQPASPVRAMPSMAATPTTAARLSLTSTEVSAQTAPITVSVSQAASDAGDVPAPEHFTRRTLRRATIHKTVDTEMTTTANTGEAVVSSASVRTPQQIVYEGILEPATQAAPNNAAPSARNENELPRSSDTPTSRRSRRRITK